MNILHCTIINAVKKLTAARSAELGWLLLKTEQEAHLKCSWQMYYTEFTL